MTAPPTLEPGQVIFDLWGGEAEVSTCPTAMAAALPVVREVIDAVDRTCSTYRDDSDISRVNNHAGRWVEVDPLFTAILSQSLQLCAETSGRMDPTVGTRTLSHAGTGVHVNSADYRQVQLRGSRVRVPEWMRLDLGAIAKAWCADAAAARATQATGDGVLVGLLGDIATAGPAPADGWAVICGDDHRDPQHGPSASVRITDGGLATSSTRVRPTAAGAHILDPATLRPILGPWRTVTVAAATCAQANAAATAALVMGQAAPAWLTSRRLPARLVRADDFVQLTGGWPE